MATSDYGEFCYRIYEQIYLRLQNKDVERRRFVAKGTAKKVLDRDNLRSFFQSLSPAGETANSHFGVPEDELIKRVRDRNLLDFLAVLIFANCPIETARAFTKRLVAHNDWPVERNGRKVGQLPASREELIELFGVVAADMFISKQACFCAVVIRKREEVRIANLESQRLPYLEETPLGSGSFGSVYKVKIAKEHFFDPQTQLGNPEPLELARKDYLISSQFPARGEREIMEKILTSSGVSCNNILENWGSLEIGPTTYSLFMPWAMFDLRQYMMRHHSTAPKRITDKAKIIEAAEGLAGGLNFLHTELQTAERDQLVCYHMDLKPSNILIFREQRHGEEFYVWKLSDFGMARVKLRKRDQDVERERDFNSWFLRRQVRPPDPSATINRRGEGTYLAPESISSAKSMGTGSDVWSLGCVLSVVFAYLEDGWDGVEGYQTARLNNPKSDGYDRFFLRGKGFLPSKAHPEIHRWHTQLIDEASQRSEIEGKAVESMLRYLEDHVFQMDQTKRKSAKEVKDMLLTTFRRFKTLGDMEMGNYPLEKHLQPPGKFSWKGLIPMRPRSPSNGQIDSWSLSPSEDFKGCDISPDASLVAYWTDVKILLYTSQSLSPRQANAVAPVASRKIEETGCIWKTVVVTQKYLIASTTGPSFSCFIFDLHRGEAVEVTLDHWYRLTLPLPEISLLALSTDRKTLACVLRHKDDERRPASFFTASIERLIEYAKRPKSSSTDGTTGQVGDPSYATLWEIRKLSWPASAISHLALAAKHEAYLVIQPELTVRTSEHKITVVRICLVTKSLVPVIIESKGFDMSSTAGLFTTFAPLRCESATCAIVTREKQLHVQSLVGDEPTPGIHKDIKHHRVVKLLIDADDGIFALGTAVAHHRMQLMELAVAGSPVGAREVSVREIAHIPGLAHHDDFTQCISREGDEKYVLIAALVGPNRRAIYRIQLEPERMTQ
ncbi:hypothetical protein OQA88_7655 [Cercophora sp. LCS_1]